MRFIKKETDLIREVDASITLLDRDEEITEELIKPNYENKESPWVFEIEEGKEIKLGDVVQAKVNIKGVGYFLVSYDSTTFNKDTRKELFDKLISLKEIDAEENNAKLVEKMTKVLSFINEYKPYYVLFYIEGKADQVECIIHSINVLEAPLLYVKDKKLEALDVVNSEEKDVFEHYLVSNYSEDKVKRVHEILEDKNEEDVNKDASFGEKVSRFFKGFARPFKQIGKYKVEHLFNALYALLIAVCTLLCAVYMANKQTGIGVLFLAFDVLFFTLIVYNLYLYGRDYKESTIHDFIIFAFESIIFIALGVLFGYLLCKSMVKFENPIDYKKNIAITIIISLVLLTLIHLTRFGLSYLFKKLKEKASK